MKSVMPKKKPVRRQRVNVNELFKLIPDSLLVRLTDTYSSDKWVSKLKSASMFKLVLYSLLRSNRFSLRQMAENYSTPFFRVLDQHAISETAHNSIRDRLLTMPVSFFRDLYDHLYEQLDQHYTTRQLKRYHLKRYDSTMIRIFSHQVNGMKVGNMTAGQRQVKLTTELRDDLLIRMRFFHDQSYLSEERALAEMIESIAHSPDDILVFDRGLNKRATLATFEEKGIHFVTRIHENPRFDLLKKHRDLPTDHDRLHFLKDSDVLLYSSGDVRCETPFRLIQVIRRTDDTRLSFLTNIQHLSAIEITELYRSRWDIEILFRFLKQELNLTHFVSHKQNAIQIMIYCTLIAAMLILTFRKLNHISSFRLAKIRFFDELQASVCLEYLQSQGNIDQLKNTISNYLNHDT